MSKQIKTLKRGDGVIINGFVCTVKSDEGKKQSWYLSKQCSVAQSL
jgi:hypothetical protein